MMSLKKCSIKIAFALFVLWCLFAPGLSFAASGAFKTVIYTGDGGTQQISGIGFKPDLVWVKNRGASYNHTLFDSVRGDYFLAPNEIDVESAWDAIDYHSDGITLKSASIHINQANEQFVAWCWKAGDSIVSNTDGNIISTVSANTDSGFSIVKYSGSGATGSFGHGLGIAPSMVIIKCLNAASNWYVWHKDGNSSKNLRFNTAAEEVETGNRIYDVSDTTVTLTGGISALNQSGYSYIAYVWTEVPGFSSFGSYTGNGSLDGPTIECGFRPQYVLVKRTDYQDNWAIHDIVRDPDGELNNPLYANTNQAEDTALFGSVTNTGFSVKSGSAMVNASGATYIYAAFGTKVYDHSGTFTVEEKIGIGTLQPQHELEVNGTVKAKEVIVSTEGWADYVFDKDYRLQDLGAVEDHIRNHRHLPGIPPAEQIESRGLSVSDMFELQMKKIEELTLYIIEQNKKITHLEQQHLSLKQENSHLKRMIINPSSKSE